MCHEPNEGNELHNKRRMKGLPITRLIGAWHRCSHVGFGRPTDGTNCWLEAVGLREESYKRLMPRRVPAEYQVQVEVPKADQNRWKSNSLDSGFRFERFPTLSLTFFDRAEPFGNTGDNALFELPHGAIERKVKLAQKLPPESRLCLAKGF